MGAVNIRIVENTNLGYAFLSQAIGLLCMVLLFFVAGLVFSKGVRFQDVLGTTTLARYPYIIPAIFGYFMNLDSINEIGMSLLSGEIPSIGNLISLTVIGLVMVLVLVWYVALLWNAFRISTDIKGGKGVIIFITDLVMTDFFYYSFMYLIKKFIL